MARRLTQQEQEEFFLSLASHPESEVAPTLAGLPDRPESNKSWAGIPESIDLEFLDGYEFPPKG